MKKNKLSDKRKEQIKANFSLSKPPKRKSELDYYNKVKAGKARQKTGFKDAATGKYTPLPPEFMQQERFKKIAELKGITLKEFFKDKETLAGAKRLFEKSTLTWRYAATQTDKLFQNFKGNTIKVNDGNGTITLSKEEALLYIQLQQKAIISAGAYVLMFNVEFREGFNEMIIYLEDYTDAEEPEDLIALQFFDSTIFILSPPSKNKKPQDPKTREKYRKNNAAKINAAKKLYREQNPEKIKAAKKLYRQQNQEKISAAKKLYREKKKDERSQNKKPNQ